MTCVSCRKPNRRVFALGVVIVLAAAVSPASGEVSEPPRAGESSQVHALVAQAIALEHGEGVTKNPTLAALLYCRAARGGDAEAQFNLGWMYANGRGVPRDDSLAAGLFKHAAGQGHVHAQRLLKYLSGVEDRLPDCMTARMPPPPTTVSAVHDALLASLPPEKQRLAELARRLAIVYDVEPRLALAVIAVESNFEPRAQSAKNARGLMQLIPETAERFGVKNVFDPAENVRGGLAYLRWLLAYYRGRVVLAAAAYNAGEGAVDRHRGVPPYPETQNYVRRIAQLFPDNEHRYDAELAGPSPVLALPRLRSR
jgi:Transglycosylase SLT domain/Sel1 repeat